MRHLRGVESKNALYAQKRTSWFKLAAGLHAYIIIGTEGQQGQYMNVIYEYICLFPAVSLFDRWMLMVAASRLSHGKTV